MTNYSYGNKQYIAVEGMDKAFALAKAIMQARDCQVMVQLDDCDIYVVSWANRYGGKTFSPASPLRIATTNKYPEPRATRPMRRAGPLNPKLVSFI